MNLHAGITISTKEEQKWGGEQKRFRVMSAQGSSTETMNKCVQCPRVSAAAKRALQPRAMMLASPCQEFSCHASSFFK